MDECEYFYDAAVGPLKLRFVQGQCCALQYVADESPGAITALPDGDIKRWLDDYFGGYQTHNLPELAISGTVFQRSVYRLMLQIPYGQTLSYGAAARRLGSAARAVGQACKRNPLPILIPCHRIVAKNGIGGYEGSRGGYRLDRKKWLLRHESRLN